MKHYFLLIVLLPALLCQVFAQNSNPFNGEKSCAALVKLSEIRNQKNSARVNRSSVTRNNSNFQFLTGQEPVLIVHPLEDFQVNENAGYCNHFEPAVCMDRNGNFILVWSDTRNNNRDIFGQRFDSTGMPLGTEFFINSDINVGNQYAPDPGIDASGNFVVVWVSYDDYYALNHVYCQRFDRMANKIGLNFRIDESGLDADEARIDVDSMGNFVVVWSEFNLYKSNNLCKRYNYDGVESGKAFLVDDDDKDYSSHNPVVAIDDRGNFVIAWCDHSLDNVIDIIFCKQYDIAGNLVHFFLVNDYPDHWETEKHGVGIGVDGHGNIIVGWKEKYEGNWHIYGQRLSTDGSHLGSNFKINDTTEVVNGWNPIAIDAGGDSNFVVTWYGRRNGKCDIYCQQYHMNGLPIGPNVKVNDAQAKIRQSGKLDVSMSGTGAFVAVWEDWRNGNSDIYGQRFSTDGTRSDQDFKLTVTEGSSNQRNPAIGVDKNGNFVIVWQDARNVNWDIFSQRFDHNGVAIGANLKVNDDGGSANQYCANIAMTSHGEYVVTWLDQRNGRLELYGQRFDNTGAMSDNNFKVNDNSGQLYDSFPPAIGIDARGYIVIAWVDRRNGYDIYSQRFDNNNNALGDNFKVNDDDNNFHFDPAIAVTDSGDFILAWSDSRQSWERNIYCQRYHCTGIPNGSNFKVSDHALYCNSEPDIGVDGKGNFIIAWCYGPFAGKSILFQRFDRSGNALGINTVVNDAAASLYVGCTPALTVDDFGNFSVAWTDWRNGNHNPDIYCQHVDSNGRTIGSNYRVNNDPGDDPQSNIDIDLNNRFLYYTWEDSRVPGQAVDIFARIDQINKAPASPTLLAPAHLDISRQQNPTFVFSVPEDPDSDSLHVKVEIASDSTFSRPIGGSPIESDCQSPGFNPKPPLPQGCGTCSYTLPSVLGDGIYSWRISARDGYGYGRLSTVASIGVDTTPPFTSDRNPAPNACEVPINSNIEVHIQDTLSGVDSSTIVMLVDGISVLPDISGSIYDYSLTFDPVVDFNYNDTVTVSISAADRVGNVMATDSYCFFIQNYATLIEKDDQERPIKYALYPNYPNPFNLVTVFYFAVPEPGQMLIEIFNTGGQLIKILAQGYQQAGFHSVQWNGTDNNNSPITSGIYICRLTAGGRVCHRKVTLIK